MKNGNEITTIIKNFNGVQSYNIIPHIYHKIVILIIESVDSISRDGPDTPIYIKRTTTWDCHIGSVISQAHKFRNVATSPTRNYRKRRNIIGIQKFGNFVKKIYIYIWQ